MSPLGWVETLRPVTAPHPLALLPIAGFTAVLVVLTVRLAGARDLGASMLPDRTSAPARTRLLSGPLGLTVRLERSTLAGWAAAVGASRS